MYIMYYTEIWINVEGLLLSVGKKKENTIDEDLLIIKTH